LAISATLLFALTAQEIPVRWELQDCTLDHGGTAVAAFIYDADTSVVSGIDITTMAGSSFGGAAYEAANSPPPIFTVIQVF
jgi:hypothetical protein